MKNITLATSASCGPCHMLKSKIEKMGLTVEIKDYFDHSTHEWFQKHGIRAVPKLVIEDGENVEIIQGADDILERLKNEK